MKAVTANAGVSQAPQACCVRCGFRGEVLVVRLHLEGQGELCPVEIQRKELRDTKHRAGSGNE